MKNNYSATIFWISVVALAVVGYMIYSVQNITRASYLKHQGVVLEISTDTPDIETIELEILNQNDNQWGMNEMFDDLMIRMFQHGSQITCTASIFKRFDIDRNPYELYSMFYEADLYSPDLSDPMSYAPEEYIYHKYKSTYSYPKMNNDILFDTDTVIEHLKSGTPILVRTSHPMIGRYWVVIIGITNGEFIIMDPLSEEYGTLSTYNNKIYEIIYFTKE